jgi:hypothetical protein
LPPLLQIILMKSIPPRPQMPPEYEVKIKHFVDFLAVHGVCWRYEDILYRNLYDNTDAMEDAMQLWQHCERTAAVEILQKTGLTFTKSA